MSSSQFAFDLGASGGAPAIDLLYFALRPDARAATRAIAIAERDFADQDSHGFIYRPDRLHVSVDKRWEGRGLPDIAMADAMKRGARVALPPFEIRLDQLKSNGNGANWPRALLSREASPGFGALVQQLGQMTDRAIKAIPHMTLYRADRPAPAIEIADAIAWTARELVLIHAQKGAGTARIAARWPLR
ncbi:2'-5' RNA ligase family protein [Ensifer adhaerens]|uniref:2'-5' RNA ligase family protein n=1 Tax=Ensifer adhaerens TaxID=106592 RepID=UPI00098EECE9|nr:hypothetical protein [Ensifer adhaerens]